MAETGFVCGWPGAVVMMLQTSSYASLLICLRIKLVTHPYPFTLLAHASAW
jgi:hypothetical protein